MKISQNPSLRPKLGGFLTEELREKGERVGFKIISLSDRREALLASKSYPSPYHVGKYGVNIEGLEKTGCSAVGEALHSGKFILVDEIGKMELSSEKFKNIIIQALSSPQKMLATIMEKSNEFADSIKRRSDVRLIHLSRENFEKVHTEILNWFKVFDQKDKASQDSD